MAVVALFTDIISSKGTVSVGLIHDMNGLATGPSINLALMAVEAAKHHLLWDRNDSEDSHSELMVYLVNFRGSWNTAWDP